MIQKKDGCSKKNNYSNYVDSQQVLLQGEKGTLSAVCIIQSQVFISVTFSSFKSSSFEAEKKCANNSWAPYIYIFNLEVTEWIITFFGGNETHIITCGGV